jgi:uncharacterized membrane protein YeaQ/YmgE (transglycosylase-associated protein family)
MNYMIVVVIGVVAGWVAGQFVKGSEMGVGIDLAAGALGAIIAVFISRMVSPEASAGFMMSFLISIMGGVVLLYAMRKVMKAREAPAPKARRRR